MKNNRTDKRNGYWMPAAIICFLLFIITASLFNYSIYNYEIRIDALKELANWYDDTLDEVIERCGHGCVEKKMDIRVGAIGIDFSNHSTLEAVAYDLPEPFERGCT